MPAASIISEVLIRVARSDWCESRRTVSIILVFFWSDDFVLFLFLFGIVPMASLKYENAWLKPRPASTPPW